MHPISQRFVNFAQSFRNATVYEGSSRLLGPTAIYTSGAGTPNPDDFFGLYRDESSPKASPVITMNLPLDGKNPDFEMGRLANMLQAYGLASLDEKCQPVMRRGVTASTSGSQISVTVDTHILFSGTAPG